MEVRLNSSVTNVTPAGRLSRRRIHPGPQCLLGGRSQGQPAGPVPGRPARSRRARDRRPGPDDPGPPGGLRRRRHGGGQVGRHRQAGPGRGAGRHPDGRLRGPDDRERGRPAGPRPPIGRRSPTGTRARWPSSARPRPSPRSGRGSWAASSPGCSGAASTSLFLIGFRNRWRVLLSWFWDWLLNARDARLITGDARLDIQIARPPDFVPDDPPEVVADRRSAAAAGEPPGR